MVSMKVNQASLKFTIVAIGNARVSMKRAAFEAVKSAGQALRARVRDNVSATDHTMAALAAEGHPYARRHGQIKQIHRPRKYMLDARHLIHTRSGSMLSSLRGGMRSGPKIAYDLDFDLTRAPWIAYVLYGTKKMLPRDPLWATATSPAMIDEMRLSVIRVLGKALKSQATVRFGS